MAEEASLKLAGLGPRFSTALELLIQAHIEVLKNASSPSGVDEEKTASRELPQELSEWAVQDHSIQVDTEEGDASDAIPYPSEEEEEAQRSAPRNEPSVANLQKCSDPHPVPSLRLLLREAHQETSAPKDCTEMVTSKSVVTVTTRNSKMRWSRGERHLDVDVMAGLFGNAKHLFQTTEIDEQEYDVSQYYHTDGISQSIARNGSFDYITLAIIVTNAFYMGIDADFNHAPSLNDSDPGFIVIENMFAFFFTFELAVRFSAFKSKRNCLKDSWFKFDTFLVLIIWFETWLMPALVEFLDVDIGAIPIGPLRLLRLLRLARMVRIIRAFPELVTMIKGMCVAVRAVGSAMLLLIISIYAWAIAMHSFMKDEEELFEYWGTVTRCMMTLMANGCLGDSIGTVMRGVARNVPALTALILFVIFSAHTVLNMLVAVLCEVHGEVANAEKEFVALAKLKSTLLVMLKNIDLDGSGDISKDELVHLLHDDATKAVLTNLRIDVGHIVDTLDMHLHHTGVMQIATIMELLIESQGERSTTVEDLCDFSTFLRWAMQREFDAMREDAASTRQMVSDIAKDRANTSVKAAIWHCCGRKHAGQPTAMNHLEQSVSDFTDSI